MSPIPTFSRPRDPAKKLVLFHRDFRGFTGGHLKVWHYFNHVASSPAHEPRVAFSAESKWDASNPWFPSPDYLSSWTPEEADILFLAGTDWQALPEAQRLASSKPIINLIQHPRHADKGSELREFLSHRAVRICVSNEVAAAINATGEVNGPVFVIPNGIELEMPAPKPFGERTTDLLICGLKAAELAGKVREAVRARTQKIEYLTDWIPRPEYLELLADAKVTLFLPRPVEGFYLPPLEGMACGTTVVCPDCVGNRSFCLDGTNCFRPAYDSAAIVSATETALQQTEAEWTKMQEEAQTTVRAHSLENERARFSDILGRVETLWRHA
jgi:hypothetical protein